MVAVSTVMDYFNAYARGEDDEAAEIIENILSFPAGARLYQRSNKYRHWTFAQSPADSYAQYVTVEILNIYGEPEEKAVIKLSILGVWKNHADGTEIANNGITVTLADYRTSKEAVEALCNKFVERFQKPSSQGSVKVFYDESKFMWCWKRPNSPSIVYNAERTEAYHKDTCMSVIHILGDGVVPDEWRFLSDNERLLALGRNPDAEITIFNSKYYFSAAMRPIYKNQIPFNVVHAHVPASSLVFYEFVMVNDERVYINLKKIENPLLNTPIHGYSTRIETLVPADKLFLTGKHDLYARRDKSEIPFLGWELEACSNISEVGSAKTATAFKEHMPWLIMCKQDGSISPEGFETVSVPATLDFWQESNLSSALDSMRVKPYNMRSWEHSRCGFHVHVSRSALSVLDLQKLERFVHNPENNKFIVTIAGRSAGTYQQYVPDLFNNRKKWANVSSNTESSSIRGALARAREEDITYFSPTFESARQYADNYIGSSSPSPNDRLISFGLYLNEWVEYTSLDNIIHRSSSILNDRYPNMLEYSVGDIFPDLSRITRIYLPTVCYGQANPSLPETHETFIRFLFEEVICVGRPKFSSVVNKFFPEWNLTTQEERVVPDWKVGTRKSAAPFKRSLSGRASQLIKGPVGKGVNSRYDALNTTNKNTVEFRMFKGTMNGTTVMRYLEFVDALVRFVANTNATDAGLHYTAFIKWLRGDSFNIARYEHLVSFITENGFIDRKDIRRKTLPVIVSEDKNVKGLVACPAKGFEDLNTNRPIGSFTLAIEQQETVAPLMTDDEAEAVYDVLEGEPPCDCEDGFRVDGFRVDGFRIDEE